MSALTEFDIGPLTWVKGEIDQALTRAREALAQFAASPADLTQLKFCQTHLHQVTGAIQMVGLDGVTGFCEEIEKLVTALEKQGNIPPDAVGVIDKACANLSRYLDDLVNGEPNVPLKLFPEYRELLRLRGEDNASPSDLFFPDLTVRPPKASVSAIIPEAGMPTHIKALRARFQRGLLLFLRGNKAGLSDMVESVKAIESTQTASAQRAFWWSSVGLFDGLAQQGLEVNVGLKQLCARIDMQIRYLAEGSPKVAERLFRDVLYFVATSQPVSERIKELKKLYQLDAYIPVVRQQTQTEIDFARVQPVLREYREILQLIKTSWVKHTSNSGDTSQLRGHLAAATEKVEKLQQPALQKLQKAIDATLTALPAGNVNEVVAMEFATALLLAENAIDNFARLSDEFPRQVEVMVQRLKSALSGKPLDTDVADVSLLDEISRKAQEKLLISQVVQEIQTNLRYIEQVLDTFFRDNSKREELNTLPPFMKQVLGAFSILGLDNAAKLLKICQDQIEQFAVADYMPAAQEMELLAESLSNLGFYIQAVEHGQTSNERVIEALLRRHAGLPEEQPETEELAEPEKPATVEASIEAEKQQVNNLFDAWQQKPDDQGVKDELRQALTSVKQDAALVADNTLRDQTANVLSLLDQSDGTASASLTEAMGVLAMPKAAAADAPSEAAVRMVNASTEMLDAELLEIFLEEAQEVLDTVLENLRICQAQPNNHGALVVIRRGFHTLKGSGRMVGLNDFGEIAWAVEQILNKWLEQEKVVTPALLNMVAIAHENFGAWVTGLKASGSIAVDAQPLLDLVARVDGGEETLPDVEAPVGSPVEEPQVIELSEPVAIVDAEDEEPVELELTAITEAASDTEAEVLIGEVVLSPTLYGILVEEAGQHLATLVRELENLRQSPDSKIKHEFLRAAHTLCGIHRTAGFPVIAELGFALEQWLLAVSDQPIFQDPDYMQVLESTVSTLTRMVQGLQERRAPSADDKRGSDILVSHLREMVQQANNQTARGEKTAELAATQESQQAMVEPISTTEEDFTLPVIELEADEPAPVELEEAPPLEIPVLEDEPIAVDEAIELESLPTVEVVPGPPVLSLVETPVVEAPVVAASAIPVQKDAVQAAPEYEGDGENLATLHDDIDEQLLPIFLEEAEELFPLLGNELRAWRASPNDPEPAQGLGRVLHTLKGSARMAGAMRLGELAHHMETRVATGDLPGISGPAFFEALDADFDRISESLERLQAGERGEAPKPAQTATAEASVGVQQAGVDMEAGAQRAMLRVRADMVDRLVNEAGEVSIARSRIEGEMRAVKQNLFELTENVVRLRSQLREIEIQAESQMQSQLSLLKEEEEGFDPLEFDRFTRFQELTRMMAESVNDVATVQLNLLKNLDETDAALLSQARMNRDLQQELMRIRTVPFSSLMERLYRVLRQTAKEVDKKANLEIRGSQVELDRSVLEKLVAPLEHLLRNAIDHGLEPKAARQAKGKPEIGEIGLTVRQEGNEIALILSDDGAGLNLARIREKAISKGMLKTEDTPTDAQVMEFIFAPGFSTASEVTQVSGRGIGMDVVRNEIVTLGGRVQVASAPDKGTTFTLYLPLTLAVAQAVLVRAGDHTYALPSAMVEQVQELKAEGLAAVYQAKEVEWQGNKYPFAYLPRMLGDEEFMPEAMRYSPILLLRSGLERAAVHVDELIGNQEIVVKNIGPQLARVSGIAGATVLGNGMVVLIINAVQLAQRQDPALAYQSSTIPSAPMETALPAALPLIMVVDDSLTVRKITSRLLTREGFQPITAKDGVDGLQVMQEALPDVILLDIEMPRMDGFEFAKNVRSDPATAHIPIIMITSRTAEKHRARALEIGVDVYLGKPYQEEELLKHLNLCLEASKSRAH